MSSLYELAERLMYATPAISVANNVVDWNELLLALKKANL